MSRPRDPAPDTPIALVVAPTEGKLRVLPPRRFRDGREWVREGEPVLEIEQNGEVRVILAPMEGHVGGVLGRDGEPVRTGQPVAWIEAVEETER